MERLTGKDEYGNYAPRNVTLNCLKQRGELIDRLAAYEDTGQSPEDVQSNMMKWISVEDELPEESGYTIVYCADGDCRHVTFAKYQKTPKRWELSGARSYWRVLKWMTLPEPPKEVE